jgi:hypothetical protein
MGRPFLFSHNYDKVVSGDRGISAERVAGLRQVIYHPSFSTRLNEEKTKIF